MPSDNDGRTPLINAAQRNLTEIAELLMDNGADVNAQDKHGQPALWFAVGYEMPDMGKLILTHKPTVDIWVNQITPVQLAISGEQFEIAALLLNAGADVDAIISSSLGNSATGYTPLQYAVRHGIKRAVRCSLPTRQT